MDWADAKAVVPSKLDLLPAAEPPVQALPAAAVVVAVLLIAAGTVDSALSGLPNAAVLILPATLR